MPLFKKLHETISNLIVRSIPDERKLLLQPLIDFIQEKVKLKEEIRINFICTHNSRRSHLAQVWAQCMAFHFGIEKLCCYSGGTERSAIYPMVTEVLSRAGFEFNKLSEGQNPIYGIKCAENEHPVMGFSKKFDDAFNPTSDFAAIMVCSEAAENCPFVAGAAKRISIPYEDPKDFDNSNLKAEKYRERSIQIATEMFFVFSNIQAN